MSSPTKRSLEWLRKKGDHAEVCERYNSFSRTRHDLWGIADIACLSAESGAYLVQTTSASNVSARIRKISESPLLPLIRKAGIGIYVHGWMKKAGRWTVKVVDLS